MSMPCVPKTPTKAERQKLVETYALNRYAARVNAPHRVQVRFYRNFQKALTAVLNRMCAKELSPENMQGLDVAASRWWAETHKAHPGGAGRDW